MRKPPIGGFAVLLRELCGRRTGRRICVPESYL